MAHFTAALSNDFMVLWLSHWTFAHPLAGVAILLLHSQAIVFRLQHSDALCAHSEPTADENQWVRGW
jgi:hypothetical protein